MKYWMSFWALQSVSLAAGLNLSDFSNLQQGADWEHLQMQTPNAGADDIQFQRALDSCRKRNTQLWIANGVYKLHTTLELVRKSPQGKNQICHIVGESKNNTDLYYDGDQALLSFDEFKAGIPVGRHSSVTLSNLGLYGQGKGSAVYMAGANASVLSNMYIYGFERGLDLHNSAPGYYNEINHFSDIRIDHTKFAIAQRVSNGGDASFHGNKYENIFINLNPGQTAFYNEGYYYNGRFDLLVWTHDDQDCSTTLMNNKGFSDYNIGNLTYENYGDIIKGYQTAKYRPCLKGDALFIFNGELMSPNEKWFYDTGKPTRYTNGMIDSSAGKIIWTDDSRLSRITRGMNFAPGLNKIDLEIRPNILTETKQKAQGIYQVFVTGNTANSAISSSFLLAISAQPKQLSQILQPEVAGPIKMKFKALQGAKFQIEALNPEPGAVSVDVTYRKLK